MKLYLECNMGAAGDMLMAALLELLPEKEPFLQRMNSLGLPGVRIDCVSATKCGIMGSHIHVSVHGEEERAEDVTLVDEPESSINHTHHHYDTLQAHEHSHSHEQHAHPHPAGHQTYGDVCRMIETLELPEAVKENALAVYRLIGEAEAAVHAEPIEQIHFHEVGTMDAVADVVGCCLLIHLLNVNDIAASPVHVGSGFVRCAHGILPVPAPATAQILKGVPIYGGKIKGELCTPTGAALLRHFVRRFGDMEPMAIVKIGYGMGTKDFEAANCVRAFLGEAGPRQDEIIEISCNLDDMTPEAMGYASELLFKNGALDVFTTPITMKKSRPATMLTCLCRPEDQDKISRLMLLHTTTLGVRCKPCRRNILSYSFYTVQTTYGPIRIKAAEGDGILKEKPEYEDVKQAAEKHGVPFAQVYWQAMAAIK